jgi:hypothetical protein
MRKGQDQERERKRELDKKIEVAENDMEGMGLADVLDR